MSRFANVKMQMAFFLISHSVLTPLRKRFLPYSFHPTLYVLFLTTLTKPLPERMGLESLFKGGIEERVKDTGRMGLSGRKDR